METLSGQRRLLGLNLSQSRGRPLVNAVKKGFYPSTLRKSQWLGTGRGGGARVQVRVGGRRVAEELGSGTEHRAQFGDFFH